jgi:hypothetical protein
MSVDDGAFAAFVERPDAQIARYRGRCGLLLVGDAPLWELGTPVPSGHPSCKAGSAPVAVGIGTIAYAVRPAAIPSITSVMASVAPGGVRNAVMCRSRLSFSTAMWVPVPLPAEANWTSPGLARAAPISSVTVVMPDRARLRERGAGWCARPPRQSRGGVDTTVGLRARRGRRGRRCDDQGVAVGGRLGDQGGRYGAAGARVVFHRHPLPPRCRQPVGYRTGDDVHATTGSERVNHPHGALRKGVVLGHKNLLPKTCPSIVTSGAGHLPFCTVVDLQHQAESSLTIRIGHPEGRHDPDDRRHEQFERAECGLVFPRHHPHPPRPMPCRICLPQINHHPQASPGSIRYPRAVASSSPHHAPAATTARWTRRPLWWTDPRVTTLATADRLTDMAAIRARLPNGVWLLLGAWGATMAPCQVFR